MVPAKSERLHNRGILARMYKHIVSYISDSINDEQNSRKMDANHPRSLWIRTPVSAGPITAGPLESIAQGLRRR